MKRLSILCVLISPPAVAQDLIYDFSPTVQCLAGQETIPDKMKCVGMAATACMEASEGGWSTMGQNGCLDAELADWDARLNAVYPRLRGVLEAEDALLSEDMTAPLQADALRDMQRAWIAFRDAKCTFEASKWTGGTGAGPATLSCLVYETARQALLLELDLETTCSNGRCE